MKTYVKFVEKHRKPLFMLFALINIIAIIGIFQLRLNPDFAIFTTDNSIHKTYIDRMDSIFPASEQILFVIDTGDSILTRKGVEQIGRFQAFADSLEHVDIVTGPVPSSIPMFNIELNFDSINAKNIEAVEKYNAGLGQFSPLVSKGSKIYGIITVFIDNDFKKAELNSLEYYLKNRGIAYYASGNRYLQYKLIDYLLAIISFLPFIALVLLLITFRFQMRSIKATVLSVMPAGIAALWTMGIIGYSGDISIVSVIAPIFTVVIGSADGLHFVSHVQDKRHEGAGKLESIYETLSIVGIPLIITTVTSIAGFLALFVMNNAAIRELALYASTGIALAGITTWYILPLMLTGDVNIQTDNKKIRKQLQLNRIKPFIVIIAIVILLIISSFGSMRVHDEFNQLGFFKHYTAVQKSAEKIMDINGGSMPVFAFIQSKNNILSYDNAADVMHFEEMLKTKGYADKAMSIYDYIAMINGNMSHSEPQYPKNPMKTGIIMNVINSSMEGHAGHLYNAKKQAAKLIIFPSSLDNDNLHNIANEAKTVSKISDINITVTGIQYLMKDLNDNMIQNQGKTLLIAFALIFISLLISLRRILPALVSLIPIGITVFILYGFLGWFGISLNVMTATIFSITIGVGIDYAVHYTSVWMTHRREGHSAAEAADMAFKYTARPIITNALGLSIGLSALMLSPLAIHMQVSLLMWVSMISSVFVSLSLLPIMLRHIK